MCPWVRIFTLHCHSLVSWRRLGRWLVGTTWDWVVRENILWGSTRSFLLGRYLKISQDKLQGKGAFSRLGLSVIKRFKIFIYIYIINWCTKKRLQYIKIIFEGNNQQCYCYAPKVKYQQCLVPHIQNHLPVWKMLFIYPFIVTFNTGKRVIITYYHFRYITAMNSRSLATLLFLARG